MRQRVAERTQSTNGAERTVCPVCGGQAFVTIVERVQTPVHQNLVFKSQQEAVSAARGTLAMVACEACGFVFNRAFDLGKLSYSAQYDNTQLSSGVFQEHVNGLIRHLVDERGIRNAQIVEVGCGKGGFIRALVADEGANNTGYGFDPTYVGPDTDLDGRLRFERRFYDASCTDVPADAVVSRHVIEHVPQPLVLLQAIADALRGRPNARIFLETPCVEWILRNEVVWDFFYEHCSLFTAHSLTTACETVGFTVEEVRHVFGGQYLWLEAVNRPPAQVTRDAEQIPQQARQFAAAQAEKSERWRTAIRELAGSQRLALWGAAAKGTTFANLIDPDREYFACLVDINPAKQGGYVIGTGHPIVAPSELAAHGVTAAVLLNPNYKAEVEALLRALSLPISVLDIGAV